MQQWMMSVDLHSCPVSPRGQGRQLLKNLEKHSSSSGTWPWPYVSWPPWVWRFWKLVRPLGCAVEPAADVRTYDATYAASTPPPPDQSPSSFRVSSVFRHSSRSSRRTRRYLAIHASFRKLDIASLPASASPASRRRICCYADSRRRKRYAFPSSNAFIKRRRQKTDRKQKTLLVNTNNLENDLIFFSCMHFCTYSRRILCELTYDYFNMYFTYIFGGKN